jgi:hypothetical protein
MRQLALNPTKLVEIFVSVDDFLKEFNPILQAHLVGEDKWAKRAMNKSEVLTILIFFHLSGFQNFKTYYQVAIKGFFRSYFRHLYNYEQIVSLQSSLHLELLAYLQYARLSACSRANYVDSTPLAVCRMQRHKQHKTFKGLAAKGKTAMGYFFGFKLHLIVNQYGELVRVSLSKGNRADNNPELLKALFAGLQGTFYGDKGYITSLKNYFEQQNIRIITKVRKNMKEPKMSKEEAFFLAKRGIIESVLDRMKNFCQIEHSRHRSPKNFLMNLWAGIVAYTFLDKKPAINDPYNHYDKIVLYKEIAA